MRASDTTLWAFRRRESSEKSMLIPNDRDDTDLLLMMDADVISHW